MQVFARSPSITTNNNDNSNNNNDYNRYFNSIIYIQVFAGSPFKITNGSVTATSLLSKVGNTSKKTNMAKDKHTSKIKTRKCQRALKISTIILRLPAEQLCCVWGASNMCSAGKS